MVNVAVDRHTLTTFAFIIISSVCVKSSVSPASCIGAAVAVVVVVVVLVSSVVRRIPTSTSVVATIVAVAMQLLIFDAPAPKPGNGQASHIVRN